MRNPFFFIFIFYGQCPCFTHNKVTLLANLTQQCICHVSCTVKRNPLFGDKESVEKSVIRIVRRWQMGELGRNMCPPYLSFCRTPSQCSTRSLDLLDFSTTLTERHNSNLMFYFLQMRSAFKTQNIIGLHCILSGCQRWPFSPLECPQPVTFVQCNSINTLILRYGSFWPIFTPQNRAFLFSIL